MGETQYRLGPLRWHRYLGSDGRLWWSIQADGWWGGFGHSWLGALYELWRQGRDEGGAMSLGWECPKCGSVYGPQVYRCEVCVPKTVTVAGTDLAGEPVCASCGKNPCDRSLTGCGIGTVVYR